MSARDSGKIMVDGILGEVVVTCEKINWLCNEGERWLKPDQRSAGAMVSRAWVAHVGLRCTCGFGVCTRRPGATLHAVHVWACVQLLCLADFCHLLLVAFQTFYKKARVEYHPVGVVSGGMDGAGPVGKSGRVLAWEAVVVGGVRVGLRLGVTLGVGSRPGRQSWQDVFEHCPAQGGAAGLVRW